MGKNIVAVKLFWQSGHSVVIEVGHKVRMVRDADGKRADDIEFIYGMRQARYEGKIVTGVQLSNWLRNISYVTSAIDRASDKVLQELVRMGIHEAQKKAS